MSSSKIKMTNQDSLNVKITPKLEDVEFITKVKQAFGKQGSFIEGDVQVHSDPFPHCYIENFLNDCENGLSADDFIEKMQEELHSFPYNLKQNDLFSFYQTDEIMDNKLLNETELTKSAEGKTKLKGFCHLLKSKFLPWLRESTGIELNDEVDMFSAQYRESSYLLCHDDQLENRKIAYVFYLSPPGWEEKDGGALDLMDTTSQDTASGVVYQPNNVVKSVLPKRNSMIIFAVSEKSFHQVSEVLSKDKTRLSVTGWFHGPKGETRSASEIPPQPMAPALTMLQQSSETDSPDIVSEWLNDFYLIQAVHQNIQQTFEESSEIHLPTFLDPAAYQRVVEALRHLSSVKTDEQGEENMFFEHQKLPNSHDYDRVRPKYYINENSGASCLSESQDHLKTIQQLFRLFSSEEMFSLLHLLTDLDLNPNAKETSLDVKSSSTSTVDSPPTAKKLKLNEENGENKTSTKPICRCQLRHWKKGSYTLLKNLKEANFEGRKTLDFLLYLGVPEDWSEEYGGSTHYCAEDENDSLIAITPEGNSASLVYSEEHCSSFVAYINNRAPSDFFDLRVTYYDLD